MGVFGWVVAVKKLQWSVDVKKVAVKKLKAVW